MICAGCRHGTSGVKHRVAQTFSPAPVGKLVLIRCRLTIAGRGLVLGRQKVGGQAVELAIAFVAKRSRHEPPC